MNNKKLTLDQENMIITLRRQGATMKDIAKEIGVSLQTVFYRMNPDACVRVREELKNRSRERTRNCVGTYRDGKQVFLDAPHKRPRPVKCEICEKSNSQLSYHHWDDEHPSHGIWACYHCHMTMERWEKSGKEIITRYLILREIIEDEMAGLR